LRAAEELRAEHPRWWVQATALGAGNRHSGDGALS
jgi:hypothetical protein